MHVMCHATHIERCAEDRNAKILVIKQDEGQGQLLYRGLSGRVMTLRTFCRTP